VEAKRFCWLAFQELAEWPVRLSSFVYNHIGLGGVLLIDFMDLRRLFSLLLRCSKSKHVVPRPEEIKTDIVAQRKADDASGTSCGRELNFFASVREWLLLGLSWASFLVADADR